MHETWRRYRYKNMTYLLLGVLYAFALFRSPSFRMFLTGLGEFGYIGAFVGGMLFVSTFTFSIGTAILVTLTKSLHPVEIGLIAGMGAVAGDYLVFQFVRDRGVVSEVQHFFSYVGGRHLMHLFHTKYFAWTLPVVGAIIIASPLPDELGVSLMGISRMKPRNFLLLSLFLNSIGIFLIVSAAVVFGVEVK
ncbi:MAG: hypothetical protein KDE20_04370 [Caldilineaceae bacterium]|nr:hypothetical protein [Caldilineaceae bacterium]